MEIEATTLRRPRGDRRRTEPVIQNENGQRCGKPSPPLSARLRVLDQHLAAWPRGFWAARAVNVQAGLVGMFGYRAGAAGRG